MPRKMTKAEMLAFDLICEPPVKPTGAYTAQVPWHIVTALRAEFARMGYDWQKYTKMGREQHKQERDNDRRARNGAGRK